MKKQIWKSIEGFNCCSFVVDVPSIIFALQMLTWWMIKTEKSWRECFFCFKSTACHNNCKPVCRFFFSHLNSSSDIVYSLLKIYLCNIAPIQASSDSKNRLQEYGKWNNFLNELGSVSRVLSVARWIRVCIIRCRFLMQFSSKRKKKTFVSEKKNQRNFDR